MPENATYGSAEEYPGTELNQPDDISTERDLPSHPEAAEFNDDSYIPVEKVDGTSPLAANAEAIPENRSFTASVSGKTDASEFKGLSNVEAAEKCLEIVRQVDTSGIVPSVVTAQMILESGYMRTGLAQNANNCFGMKSSLSQNEWTSIWDGRSINYQTWEQGLDGTITTPVCSFRVYDSVEQSILDHSGYLLEAKKGDSLRYPGITQSGNYEVVANIIKAGGYATDLNYVQKLCSIIREYNLDRYDSEQKTRTGASSNQTASSQMR